jgi:hypothetical protein
MMKCWFAILGLMVGFLTAQTPASQADSAPLPRKKLIMTGWDQPEAAQFRRDLAQFERTPFDGVVLSVPGKKPDGAPFNSYNNLFNHELWTEAMFADSVADLQAARSTRVTENLLILWAAPGEVDWFDDAGWAVVSEKFRLMARVARQGGLRGILFDPELYGEKTKVWRYLSQTGWAQHSFSEYGAKARQRGQETMRAMAQEFPDLTMFGYWLTSVCLRAVDASGSLAGLAAEDYGLYPSFVDGWLDTAPATVKFVDGQEFAYRWDGEAAFQAGALRVKNDCQVFITPANRAKYRAQVQASFGFYLDAYVNPPGSSYYFGREGEPRVQRLESNLEAAVGAADEYVWIYGEQHRWWPPRDSGAKPSTNWAEALPGIERALLRAKDPVEAARQLVTQASTNNLLRNGGFSEAAEGRPAHWWVWQDEKQSTGKLALDPQLGAARLTKMANGCFGQNIPVKPGERYAFGATLRQAGQGLVTLRVGWKNARGEWNRGDAAKRLVLPNTPDGEWRELFGSVRVPDGIAELVVTLYANGQTKETDQAWFDDVRVVRFGP